MILVVNVAAGKHLAHLTSSHLSSFSPFFFFSSFCSTQTENTSSDHSDGMNSWFLTCLSWTGFMFCLVSSFLPSSGDCCRQTAGNSSRTRSSWSGWAQTTFWTVFTFCCRWTSHLVWVLMTFLHLSQIWTRTRTSWVLLNSCVGRWSSTIRFRPSGGSEPGLAEHTPPHQTCAQASPRACVCARSAGGPGRAGQSARCGAGGGSARTRTGFWFRRRCGSDGSGLREMKRACRKLAVAVAVLVWLGALVYLLVLSRRKVPEPGPGGGGGGGAAAASQVKWAHLRPPVESWWSGLTVWCFRFELVSKRTEDPLTDLFCATLETGLFRAKSSRTLREHQNRK